VFYAIISIPHRFFVAGTAKLLFFAFLVVSPVILHGNDAIKTTGDALQYGLPVIALGVIDLHRDGKGALQFGAAGLLALGATQGLKYAIDE
jgi:hypothetical protein